MQYNFTSVCHLFKLLSCNCCLHIFTAIFSLLFTFCHKDTCPNPPLPSIFKFSQDPYAIGLAIGLAMSTKTRLTCSLYNYYQLIILILEDYNAIQSTFIYKNASTTLSIAQSFALYKKCAHRIICCAQYFYKTSCPHSPKKLHCRFWGVFFALMNSVKDKQEFPLFKIDNLDKHVSADYSLFLYFKCMLITSFQDIS